MDVINKNIKQEAYKLLMAGYIQLPSTNKTTNTLLVDTANNTFFFTNKKAVPYAINYYNTKN